MKRQIRKSVFETNSSSTHAICITKKKDNYKIPKHIDFELGEFGWECEQYSDTYNKASYLITAIFSFCKSEADEKLARLKNILDSHNITYSIPEPKVATYTWRGKEYFYYDLGYNYIDHAGETKDFVNEVLSDSEKLFRYLFGDSFIITGDDNDYSYRDRMCIYEGEEETDYGSYPIYGDLKPEFNDYEIYEKGN